MEFVKDLGQDRSIWVVGGNTILTPLLTRIWWIISLSRWPRYCWRGVPLFTQKEAMRRFRLETVRQYRAVCGAGVWPEITGAVHL